MEEQEIITRKGCQEGKCSDKRVAVIVLLLIMTTQLCLVTHVNTEAKDQFQHNLSQEISGGNDEGETVKKNAAV